MSADRSYGIVANVSEPDRVFRMGAKAWLANGTGGEGWHRFQWIAMSRGGRALSKWAPTIRFSKFRAKWIPPHLDEHIWGTNGTRGTREQMESVASQLNSFVLEELEKHPNRRGAELRTG